MLLGGSLFLGYDLIIDFLRHHDETNPRPMIFDHLLAMSTLGTVGGFIATNSLQGAFAGFLFFGINVGLLTYWGMTMGNKPLSGPAPMLTYYEDGVTQE